MDKHDGAPNRVEQFLINAPFWARLLVAALGISVIGCADMIADFVTFCYGGLG